MRLAAPIMGVVVTGIGAGKRLHEPRRDARGTEFEQESAAGTRRHVTVWDRGTQQQRCQEQQSNSPGAGRSIHGEFSLAKTGPKPATLVARETTVRASAGGSPCRIQNRANELQPVQGISLLEALLL